MASSSKRQTTMAKRAREQAVKERRARKLEKKQERKDAKAAAAAGSEPEIDETTAMDALPAANEVGSPEQER